MHHSGLYLVISKPSSIDNWNLLFKIVKMVNIVDLYAAAQTGLFIRWQAMAEDEFWLLSVVVKPEVFVRIFEGLCWFICVSNL